MASKRIVRSSTATSRTNIKATALLLFFTFQFSIFTSHASAQTDRQFIRSGNKLYRAQKFDKADIEYRKALERNPNNAEALYNMGCAKLMQEKDSIAVEFFEKAAEQQKDKKRKAQAFHNIGFVMQNHKDYAQAIEAYKQSLRNNPADDQTRYNLALCKKLLKKQQQNQQNQQNKDDKQDQNNKNKDKNKNNQNKQEQNKQNQDKQNQDQQKQDLQKEQQQKQEQINKDNAEQLLNAAKNQERVTQEKVKRAQQRRQKRSRQKNW